MSKKKVMFKASPVLGDGVNACAFPTVEELCQAIKEYVSDYSNPKHLTGEEGFFIRLISLTDKQYEELPEL